MCNIVNRYIINKDKHDGTKTAFFKVLTRTGLAVTLDPVIPSTPSQSISAFTPQPPFCLSYLKMPC